MFKKILIANRGEIACRVIRSARKMGIATVAVYSDADAQAQHVKQADEAVHIGESPASESYLVIDKIIDACKQTGAQAVHPGYGFLSERVEFKTRLADAGIVFIGPGEQAIEAMGDKITSKKIAADAGVTTVPGFMGLIDSAEHAVKIASEIGYPVMIKASAGGGGKGMRIAWNDAEAREGYDRSRSEAQSSFGDDRLFIEKFVTEPRHIEIQILADSFGNTIYLGERECSIQRRNQKVIEEAPSPFLDESTRKRMGEEAVALAKAVNYESAGTVEFIVDKERNFYFLEMNTRLQVEHPVTELITGVDLVEQMISVANGEKLTLKQDDIKLNGWAMESRLYAEDPYRKFLPSIGRLVKYRPPNEVSLVNKVVRNDTGVVEGDEISLYYDPMIAKLCTWSDTREHAIDEMSAALDQFELEGIGHNIPFLSAVMQHDRFISGNITTAFIDEEYPDGFNGVEFDDDSVLKVIAVSLLAYSVEHTRMAASSTATPVSSGPFERVVRINRENHRVTYTANDEGISFALAGDESMQLKSDWAPGDTLIHGKLVTAENNGAAFSAKINATIDGYRIRMGGIDTSTLVLSAAHAELHDLLPEKQAPDTSKYLLCPMPGLLLSLQVAEGDAVEEGQALAIVEAMKMENVLRAEKAGTVKSIRCAEGDSLAVDETIMEFGDE